MRIGLSVAAMLLAASNMQGQTMLDSLLRALDGQRGADRVRTLGEIEWELSFTDPAKAVRYGEEALKLAESLRDSALVAQAANDLAIPLYRLGQLPQCVALNNRALSIRRSLADTMGIAASHAKLGTAFTELLDLDSALHHNQAAERIYAQRGDLERLATMRGNQARLYQQMGDLAMAEKVARSTVDLILPTGNEYVIANTYGQLAQILIDRKDIAGSEQAAQKALPLFQRIDDRAAVASISNVLGICARTRGDNNAAMEHYTRALRMAIDVGDQEGEATYQSNVANVLRDMGRLDEACARYDSAIVLCRAGGFTDQHLSALLGLVAALERKGDWPKALALQKEYQARKDSVYDRERIDALSDMQVKYETERTEKELAQERERTLAQEARIGRQRSWIGLITGGVLLTALLAWLMVARQRARSRAERDSAVIAERERGLRTMLERTDADRKRIAGELHDGVGQQLTGLKYRLEDIASRVAAAAPAEAARMKDVLALAEETGRDVRGIAHNMMPRALGDLGLAPALNDMLHRSLARPGMHFTFDHFGLDARLPQHVEVGVYRIAQELISNVLKHAEARNVSVQLLRNRDRLVLIVEDDGKGIGTRTSDGIGLLTMQDRARAMHGQLEIAPAPMQGTVATLRVPLTNGNSI